MLPNSLLAKEGRSFRIQFDENGEQQEKGCAECHKENRAKHIADPLGQLVRSPLRGFVKACEQYSIDVVIVKQEVGRKKLRGHKSNTRLCCQSFVRCVNEPLVRDERDG